MFFFDDIETNPDEKDCDCVPYSVRFFLYRDNLILWCIDF